MANTQNATDRCTQYALDVVSGAVIAGELVKQACQRHLDDLEKSKLAPYKYYFDVEKSEEIINFAEELTIAEGEENESVTAYPFQCFILGSLNGWRTKEHSYRRFRTSYVQLGRQNGKSFLNGILAAYYGNFDGYKYGKIFCTATKQDQANIVFDEIVKFINSDEELSEWFKVHEHNHTIDCLLTHSEIKALSGDTKSLDGHRAYLGIVDEYHAHKKNEVKSLVTDGKLDKAREAKEELRELQQKFDLLFDLEDEEHEDIENKVQTGKAKVVGGEKADKKNLVKSFVNIIKAGFFHREPNEADVTVYKNALTSDATPDEDGESGIGITIPDDIRTDIIELRRSDDNLEQYVNVEGVTTKTGTRNIEVDAESTPFDNVDEAADFPDMDEPTFKPVKYAIKKKGGILKMTAELLEDTAQNIMAYINKWIAKKTKATRNAMILKVDLYGDTQHFAVAAKQMDMGTRYIAVTLTRDGVVYEIPDNAEVIVNMTKPDKTHVHNDGEKSGNEALIPLTRGMLQVHGTAFCEVQLYQNGALLTSATFELEIFPSQRADEEIIHSSEYTRLENSIHAAREALQIAQDTQNTIDAAEALRRAAENAREVAEKAREIRESRREDSTAKIIEKCAEAIEEAIAQTEECLIATQEAQKIIVSQSGLDAILAAVKDYYERIRELETDININVDGGTPTSTDLLLVKGGTPFTTDYDKYRAGTTHTI